METKICNKCKEDKNINSFSKLKNNKDGLQNHCKLCSNNHYLLNKDKKSLYVKEYQLKNKDKVLIYQNNYKSNNKEYLKEYIKEYDINNKEHKLNYLKQYKLDNPNYSKDYMRSRYKNDTSFRIKNMIRSLIYNSIKKQKSKKSKKTEMILGCTFEEFKQYIESLFKPWMNWNNQGDPKDGILEFNKTWDLDHINPISSAVTEDDIYRLNHYTNFQPLCSKINREIKKNKLNYGK